MVDTVRVRSNSKSPRSAESRARTPVRLLSIPRDLRQEDAAPAAPCAHNVPYLQGEGQGGDGGDATVSLLWGKTSERGRLLIGGARLSSGGNKIPAPAFPVQIKLRRPVLQSARKSVDLISHSVKLGCLFGPAWLSPLRPLRSLGGTCCRELVFDAGSVSVVENIVC